MIGSNISITSIHPTICLNAFSKEQVFHQSRTLKTHSNTLQVILTFLGLIRSYSTYGYSVGPLLEAQQWILVLLDYGFVQYFNILLLRTVVDLIAFKVYFCDTDDVEYLPIGTDNGQQAMAAEGKIVFKTCIKQANIPITFLKRLVNQSYPTSGTKPFLSFEQAFDHWLLCELISSIRNYTIL